MAEEAESYYKRKEDKEWREKVDHEQITLMTGHQVLDKRLGDLEKKLDMIDSILRGDPRDDRDGLLEQLHAIQTELSRLNAVIFVDSTGKKGLLYDVTLLKSGELTTEHRWKFLTSTVVAIISLIGLLATNWGKISTFFLSNKRDPVEEIMQRAKRPRVHPARVRYRVVSPEDDTEPE